MSQFSHTKEQNLSNLIEEKGNLTLKIHGDKSPTDTGYAVSEWDISLVSEHYRSNSWKIFRKSIAQIDIYSSITEFLFEENVKVKRSVQFNSICDGEQYWDFIIPKHIIREFSY
jgi:hypothetical protein